MEVEVFEGKKLTSKMEAKLSRTELLIPSIIKNDFEISKKSLGKYRLNETVVWESCEDEDLHK